MPANAADMLFDGPFDRIAPLLFERVPVTICDAAGVIRFASPAFRRIIGDDAAEPADFASLAPESCPPGFLERVRGAIARDGRWQGEFEVRGAGGARHWLDTTISDLPGRPGLYLAVHVDVTPVRRLRDSEEFHANIARISPDGFFINDGEKTISVNEAGVRMLRAAGPEEIIGRTPAELFHPDSLPVVEATIRRQMAEPGLLSPMIEATLIAVDGTEVPVEVRAISYPLEGRLLTFAACRDLTYYKESERRLREELEFTNAMLNSLPGIFYQHDLDGRLLRWNRNHLRVTGYSEAEYRTMNAIDFFPDEDKALIAEAMARVMADGEGTAEAHFRTKDGRLVPYFFTGVRLDHSDPPSFVGIGIDISARKQAERELSEKTAVLEASFESSIDGIIMTDLEGRRLLTNRRITEILKMPPDIIADPTRQLPHLASLTDDPQALLDKVFWLYDHPDLCSREEIEFTDGTVVDRVSTPVRDQTGRNYGRIWMFRDVTEGRRAADRISHLARYDSLTGLANRYNLQEHMERLLAQPDCCFGLLSIDLDGFKLINDTKGHGVGDELLRRVADRLRAACPGPDMFLARPGGDEFICLVPGDDAAAVLGFADTLVRTLAEPYQLDADRRFMSGASIGVALAPDHGATVQELLSRADIALYSAKAAGKGVACLFAFDMESRVQAHVDLEADLRAAMESGEGLFVFYQPIVDAASEQVTAREALVRWHHPSRGWVSPGEFVPVAEASGLIDRLGAFVLDRACRDAVHWNDEARVAVNISAVQLGKGLLRPAIEAALAGSGLAPGRLEIEVTETALLGEEGAIIQDLRQARDLGVRVVLDDFGTGYSSLSHLRVFPFDKIKIDGSFVRDAVKRPDCAAVVRAVADLGRRLGVTTVAEGVETEAQLECIRAVGCTEIQGYVYARPAPAQSDAALVATLNARN